MLCFFNKGDEYFAFTHTTEEEESKEVKLFFTMFHKKRMQMKLRVKLLAEKSQSQIFTHAPYTRFKNFNVRYIDRTPAGIVISNASVLIATFQLTPTAVVISSKPIAASFRSYFTNLWENADH